MSDAATDDSNNPGVKAAITLGVLGAAFVMSIVIAKLVDKCYDRSVVAEEENTISDHTRELIRARLSVLQFRKKEIKKAQTKKTLSVFRRWAELVKNKRKTREDALNVNRPVGDVEKAEKIDKVVITVEQTNQEKVIENGTTRTPRFPFFSGAKVTGGAQKPPARPMSSVRKDTSEQIRTVLPVPQGQPVSSKAPPMPVVTLTGVAVDKPSVITISSSKSVHFEDETKKDEVKTTHEKTHANPTNNSPGEKT